MKCNLDNEFKIVLFFFLKKSFIFLNKSRPSLTVKIHIFCYTHSLEKLQGGL